MTGLEITLVNGILAVDPSIIEGAMGDEYAECPFCGITREQDDLQLEDFTLGQLEHEESCLYRLAQGIDK